MKPHSDVMDRIVYDLASAIDSPRSLAVWLCFKHNPVALLELPPTDLATNDTQAFQMDYMITEYLKKYKGHATGIDLEAVALEKWLASETSCRLTNERFRTGLRGLSPRASALIFRAQRKISQILGAFKLPVVVAECKWATGATYDIPKKDAAPDNKMLQPLSCTARTVEILRRILSFDPHWFEAITGILPEGSYCVLDSAFNVVPGSRFLTVPKSAKTNRCIAAEPTGNGFLQHGLHSYMRRRLKRFGIDLDNQARNQQLARRAYAEGYATLDLSAASDSISTELVYHLLPLDWALYMDQLRSPSTRINSEWIRTEKFVSMGNAFCFELETLIFYALAQAVCGDDRTVEVYGDDIIVPREFAAEVVEILSICGFTVNSDKSFVDGNFFESCGEHFHRGIRVTPPYQKETLQSPSELVRAHNRLYRFGLTLPDDNRLRRKILRLSKWMISNHPDVKVPRVPHGTVGDDGYLVDPFRMLKFYDKERGFRCLVLVARPVYKTVRSESALYAYKLRRPSFANTQSDGSAKHVALNKWLYKVRWIPECDALREPEDPMGSTWLPGA